MSVPAVELYVLDQPIVMNCFEHPQKPAVGTCTNCGRGLCKECTTVVEGQLSCRGTLPDRDHSQAATHSRNKNVAADERTVVYGTSAKMYQQAFASTAFFGLLFVIGGAIFLLRRRTHPGAILLGLGIMLGIRSAGLARAAKKYKSLAENRTEAQTVTK